MQLYRRWFDFRSILIKTREGRPIKVENNNETRVLGDANARVHGSVLSTMTSKDCKDQKLMEKILHGLISSKKSKT